MICDKVAAGSAVQTSRPAAVPPPDDDPDPELVDMLDVPVFAAGATDPPPPALGVDALEHAEADPTSKIRLAAADRVRALMAAPGRRHRIGFGESA
ncbi:MAG TPA: hypothetical protein VIC82_00420 [Candidatus Nanopelagicales bacterium]